MTKEPNQSEFSFQAQKTESRSFLTVTQLTMKVKGLLEGEVGDVWVKGEISGYKPSASGHFYFSLKDNGALLNCAMFRGASRNQSSRIKFQIEDGLEVLAHGKISVYAPRGNYQLIVDTIEPVGHGALQLAFEQLKSKLQAEGLFDLNRKIPIPAYPSKIAVITSPTGAALQDMLNILNRRNSGISVLIIPTLVQGDEAPVQIVRALEVANRCKLADVIVLARGGGSIEDLWSFNNEAVVRAVAASELPIISAIGHEVDFTLCDFASDLRAPTPSAAAELVSKNKLDLIETLHAFNRRLSLLASNKVAVYKSKLFKIENQLISPVERMVRLRKALEEIEVRLQHVIEGRFPGLRQMIDEFSLKLKFIVDRCLSLKKQRLENLVSKIEALSPLKVLGRGYTLIQDPVTGVLIKSVKEAKPGHQVALVFQDGKTNAKII